MNKVKKAVIPVAGFGTRFLPFTKAVPKMMLPIIDKPAIQYIVEEAVNSGIEEILFITSSYKNSVIDHFDKNFELENADECIIVDRNEKFTNIRIALLDHLPKEWQKRAT